MWLKDSSIGRKFVMSVTGTALVLFLLFHGTMNLVVIISPESYNAICSFLGANWYALVGTVGLAALVVIHFVYALYLTILNYRARGEVRYTVSKSQSDVEFSSRNMFVLGLIIVLFLVLHLYNFWYKMQFVEIARAVTGDHEFNTGIFSPTSGAEYVKALFTNPIYAVLYLVWLGAIWFHLTHGVWSALQTLGCSNQIWFKRIKCIGKIVATMVVLLFVAVVVYYCGYAIGNNTTNYVW
jgi:succinate dehydrogenase / fumarate reductase cytochrome b subunit